MNPLDRMKNTLNFEELVEKITKETGRTKKEVLELIEEKKDKFSGLLTNEGAAFMIAKELGLELGLDEAISSREKISELKEGQRNIELKARILAVFSPRTTEKNGKKKKYCSLLLGDESGEIRLALWEKDVDLLDEKKVEKGDIAILKNCFASTYNNKLQLSLGYNGKIEFSKEDDTSLPAAKGNVKKVNELSEGMNGIDLFCRVARIFELRQFTSVNGKGTVLNLEIADETGTIRATAWQSLAEQANALQLGELIKIENAYTKKGINGLELHLGWSSRILREPSSVELPEISKLLGQQFKRTRITELEEGMNAEILGIVSQVSRIGEFNVCKKCGKRVETEGNSFVCEKCGEVKPKKRLFVSIVLDDGEENMNCTFFGRNALSVLGIKTIEEIPTENSIKDKIIGKTILVSGKANENRYDTEQIDFIVSEVKKPNIESEIKRTIEEIEKV